MRQITLACQPSFEKYARVSRREQFLNTMEEVVPWGESEALIELHYPKAGKGRHPIALSTMLRLYFLQHWFNLSDPGAEDALYESPVLRGFAGVDLGRMAVPDETTIPNFRHLLEAHDLCGQIFEGVNLYLDRNGIRISTGTIVDATIIPAPSSTNNANQERDPETHQTKEGNQYFFGARRTSVWIAKKASCTSVCTSAASVHDKHMLPDLLHGEEKNVWGDGGYQGQTATIHAAAPEAQDMTHRRAKNSKGEVDEDHKRKNRTKSRVRAKVEWPFRILKRVFGYTKVRYCGIVKNHHWHLAAFALVNLYLNRKRLAPQGA